MTFANRAVPIVLAAVLIDMIGFGIVIPILPRLITGLGKVDLDRATRISGYLLGVYALTQFFDGPIIQISGRSAMLFPAMNGLLSRLADASHQGALQGGIGRMGSVAAIIAPLMLTQALANGVEAGFPGAAFLLAGILAAAALLIVVWEVLGRVSVV